MQNSPSPSKPKRQGPQIRSSEEFVDSPDNVQFREFISHGNIEQASRAATANHHKMVKNKMGGCGIQINWRNKMRKNPISTINIFFGTAIISLFNGSGIIRVRVKSNYNRNN